VKEPENTYFLTALDLGRAIGIMERFLSTGSESSKIDMKNFVEEMNDLLSIENLKKQFPHIEFPPHAFPSKD